MALVHRLLINSKVYEALVDENETLLNVLRYNLDLIGTKQGCDKGDCGACTVLVNGASILSCLSLAHNFDENDHISTIEGLAEGNEPDLLMLAFLKSGALQCGFCQPGMVLSAKALLESNTSPSLVEIKEALAGNLCRCTGYTKIYLAIFAASMVMTAKAKDVDEALHILRESRIYLGEL